MKIKFDENNFRKSLNRINIYLLIGKTLSIYTLLLHHRDKREVQSGIGLSLKPVQ